MRIHNSYILKLFNFHIAAAALLLTACGDFLDEMPDNRTEVDTEDHVQKLLVSAYPEGTYMLLGEYMSDNVDDHGANNPYTNRFYNQVYAWQDVTETENDSPEMLWQASYNAIAAANQALKSIDEMGGATTQGLREARGEALLCRAYNHFILTNIFCMHYRADDDTSLGIPYATEPETTLTPQYERSTVKQNYLMMERDLQEGLELVGESYYQVPKYHFNKKAAYAFATRFYLYYEQYDKAINYASLVLGSNPKTMLRDYEAQSTMTQEFTAIRLHYIEPALNSNLLLATAYSMIGWAFGPYTAGKRYSHGSYISLHEDANALNVWGLVGWYMGLKEYAATNREYYIYWRTPNIVQSSYARTAYPLFTADEVLLDRAEAYILQKRYDEAAQDLTTWLHNTNQTANDRQLQLTPDTIASFYRGIDYSYTPSSTDPDGIGSTVKKHLHPAFSIDAEGSVQECMLQLTLCCRRIETLGLGRRWFDVKRWGIEIPRRVLNASGNPERITDWLTPDDPRRAVQLPQKVITAGLPANPRSVKN